MTTLRTQTLTTSTPNSSVADQAAGLRILIAEDRKDCADSLAMLLRLYGHTVMIAQNGPNTLEMVQAHQPDVLLLDIGLPGMDGYAVANHLKDYKRTKTPLIIAVTGFGREEDRRHAQEAGIDLHMVKPLDPEQLRIVLERFQIMLDKRPGDR